MADHVIFIGWNRPHAGQEQKAIGVFGRALEYYTRLQSEGKIEGFEAIMLRPHGGDLNGFILMRGEAEKLAQIQNEEEWLNLEMEAVLCTAGLGTVPGYIGDGTQNFIARELKILGG